MRKIFFIVILTVVMVAPALAFGADLGNPTGETGGTLLPNCAPTGGKYTCGWSDLIQFASNILNFLVYLSIIAAAVMFAYAGYLYMSDGGSMEQVKDAHGIFTSTVVGIIIVLVAWLSVDALVKSLTGHGIREWSSNSTSYNIQLEPLQYEA